MRVIVTGGAGYIGRETCKALERAGFSPIVADIKTARPVDCREFGPLCDFVDYVDPVGVIHLAAHSDVAESVRDPGKYLENRAMAGNVAIAAGSRPVVMASSAAVYGDVFGGLITERYALQPVSPYGQSKVDSEGFMPRAMRLRYFNVVGGKDPSESHLVPSIARAMDTGRPLRVNGDGSCVRDYVDVRDVARANVLALEVLIEGAKPEALNICSGEDWAVLDIVRLAEGVAGQPVAAEHGPAREGDPPSLVGDRTRAKEVIGWEPRHSLIDSLFSALVMEPV